MTIVRRRHNSNFTIVPNAIFEHPDLSVEAKGLLGYLLSRPPDWKIRLAHIGPTLGIGRDKTERIFQELKEAGYVIRGKQQRPAGKWGAAQFEVWDEPNLAKGRPLGAAVGTLPHDHDTSGSPCPEKAGTAPCPEKPLTENQGTYKEPIDNKTAAAPREGGPPAGSSLISETAFTIAAEIGREAGYPTEQDWPPGWCGAPHQVQRFLSDGVPSEIVKSACTAVLRRGRVPKNFAYFTKPIVEAWARHKAPLPAVASAQTRTTRNAPNERTGHDVARELAEQYRHGADR